LFFVQVFSSDNNNTAAILTAHTNNGIHSGFILIVVEIKFTAPRVEETPASKTKIHKAVYLKVRQLYLTNGMTVIMNVDTEHFLCLEEGSYCYQNKINRNQFYFNAR
jgi:hypothetical protein